MHKYAVSDDKMVHISTKEKQLQLSLTPDCVQNILVEVEHRGLLYIINYYRKNSSTRIKHKKTLNKIVF